MKKIRVVVVDDSAFSRRTITRMLEDIATIDVVGYATNGEEGIQAVIALKPDLVTLDLEMPKMDGFTLLRILTTRFSLPVIIISALSGADKVFKALELGALDFVAKPCGAASVDLLSIKDDLRQKVLQIVALKPDGISGSRMLKKMTELGPDVSPVFSYTPVVTQQSLDIVAIGSSTGGPPALQKIFSAFNRRYPFAVVVAQHMPSGFTKAFAERLDRISCFDIKEAEDGDLILPGRILIAPGGNNMVFEISGCNVVARIVQPTSLDRYIPSVDVMLQSCASIYRKRALAVILTGMGNDGSKGILHIKDQGGYVIAESEESAVVYGMPREAVATGLVDRIVPLHRVQSEIIMYGGFA